MKNVLTTTLICLLAAAGPVLADEQTMPHGSMQGMNMQSAEMHGHHGVGKVNSVDMHKGTVNLTHGPIKSLGWMGMTMDFRVKDKAMLKGIMHDQRVDFEVVKEGPGKFYIDRIEPSK